MERLRDNVHVLRLRAVAYIGPKGQEEEAFLLLDLCRQNLVDYMRQLKRPLQDADVLTIFQSVCKAVAALHKQEPAVTHRYGLSHADCCHLHAMATCWTPRILHGLTPFWLLALQYVRQPCEMEGCSMQGSQGRERAPTWQWDLGALRFWEHYDLVWAL